MNKQDILYQQHQKAKELQQEYSQSLLLEMVKQHKRTLDEDGIELRLYPEPVDELLENLHTKRATIRSIYADIKTCFDKYEHWLDGYHKYKEDPSAESQFRVHLALPIQLLMVIYITNLPNYNTSWELLDFDHQLEPFTDALHAEGDE